MVVGVGWPMRQAGGGRSLLLADRDTSPIEQPIGEPLFIPINRLQRAESDGSTMGRY